jgi:hypothetical protein
MEVNNELHQYQWIVNEGLLRDEGTLYGIAGAGIEEKTEAIRDYYRIKKAISQTKQETLDKKIGDTSNHLSQSLSGTGTRSSGSNPANLFPIILQLLLYLGICFFNYWLESYWLSPVFHSVFICMGLYLFGLFSVFIGRSIMYNAAQSVADEKEPAGQRERWKIYFEEFGVPLIVSLFISILPGRFYPVEFSIVGTLFFFMLFLLGGKGLINTFFRVRKELTLYFQHLRQKKDYKTKTRELHELQDDLESATATLEELNGEEEYKIKVFTSEYKLAFQSRQLANGVAMAKFT